MPMPQISIAMAVKLGIALIAALAIALLVHERNHWKSVATERQTEINQDTAAFQETVAGYRSAAAQAKAEDDAKTAHVEAQQAAINERTVHDYQTRIAAARADAERLRAQSAAATHPGGSAGTSVPAVSAAGGSSQAACSDQLLTIDCRELATEQAIQLDELIKAAKAEMAIDPNAPAAPGAPK